MKELRVLLLDSNLSRLKQIGQELSKVHLGCSLESSLGKAHKKLCQVRHECIFVSQSVSERGIEKFCQEMRSNDSSMIILVAMLKPNAGLEYKLFEIGVDDVISVSTHSKVVAKRIFVRLNNRLSVNHCDNTIRLGGVMIDTKNCEIWNKGVIKTITPSQTELLQYLIANAGRTVSRKEAAEVLWANSVVDPQGKNLDMQVSKIRSLIGDDPKTPKFIRTIRGIGYQLITR